MTRKFTNPIYQRIRQSPRGMLRMEYTRDGRLKAIRLVGRKYGQPIWCWHYGEKKLAEILLGFTP